MFSKGGMYSAQLVPSGSSLFVPSLQKPNLEYSVQLVPNSSFLGVPSSQRPKGASTSSISSCVRGTHWPPCTLPRASPSAPSTVQSFPSSSGAKGKKRSGTSSSNSFLISSYKAPARTPPKIPAI